ncbi:hypothetical protein L917_12873 [Phytophthora nicotianae]|uniref:Uncharacterized protein n=1 Tax=Phytophthora nicotianae TaxID=4792 RepID=W2KS77_PHYNI|nr:hypothetical protein L917_12873 [Phytophthora nicotianae]
MDQKLELIFPLATSSSTTSSLVKQLVAMALQPTSIASADTAA